MEKIRLEYENLTSEKANIAEIAIDNLKAKKQCKLEILGIEVYFPYTPYENQLNYMSKGKYFFNISHRGL
jgi:hypothetical protein